MTTTKILIAGHIGLDPLGRHSISFIKTLLLNSDNEIFLEKNYLANDYTTLNEFFDNDVKSGKLHFSDEKPFDFQYDFLIFTDHLPLEPNQCIENKLLERNANIKICYPVFDGSIPPLHWIEFINNFDLCLSPSEYCAHNLRRYGVSIDCFGLECVCLIEDFLKIKPFQKKDNVFRIGSIGASDFRKNIPLLMTAFSKAFSKKDNVELFIHSSYGKDISCDDEIIKTYEECSKNSNIILQLKKISHQEMIDLWASFDAYISPQTTTGYFTTPLEACAVGLPVILSDIHAHLELKKFIPEKNNLFFVKHDKLSSAFHWVFGYQNLGVKFDGNEESYIETFKHIYQSRKQLSTDNLVQERKTNAEKISAQGLYNSYNTILHPNKIALAKSVSHLDENNGIFYMSTELAKKYKIFGFGKNENIPDNHQEYVYDEEKSPVFQALENSAIESQKIWSKQHKHDNTTIILGCKNMKSILSRANEYHITKMPRFMYKLFSIYSKIKGSKKAN